MVLDLNGIAIIGGLVLSQVLTLFTTPVIYLAMDKLSKFVRGVKPAVVLPHAEADINPEAS